jgi:hypothetical protein
LIHLSKQQFKLLVCLGRFGHVCHNFPSRRSPLHAQGGHDPLGLYECVQPTLDVSIALSFSNPPNASGRIADLKKESLHQAYVLRLLQVPATALNIKQRFI